MPPDREFCTEHSGLEARTLRNEEDIQTLFGKVGEAVGLLHRIDKRLEGLHVKIAAIAGGITLLVSGLLKAIPWGKLFTP